MKIEKTVKAQKQNKDGTISVTFPKQFADLLGYKAGDLFTFCLDTETESVCFYKKN